MTEFSNEELAKRVNWVIQNTTFEQITPELWQRIQAGVVKVGDYYDEDTMDKVRLALAENGFLPDDIPKVISSFQNKGILFREIEKEE